MFFAGQFSTSAIFFTSILSIKVFSIDMFERTRLNLSAF